MAWGFLSYNELSTLHNYQNRTFDLKELSKIRDTWNKNWKVGHIKIQHYENERYMQKMILEHTKRGFMQTGPTLEITSQNSLKIKIPS